MPGQGIQYIPLRIPDQWDPAWYARHIREVLAFADTRNALGDGVTITGQSGEVATITLSEDVKNLLLQSFVLATPSGFLEFERVLEGESGVIEIIDHGADSTIEVAIEEGGIALSKLHDLSNWGVLGNPVNGSGGVQNINPDGDKSVLHATASEIEFSTIDHTYTSDFDEAAQDAVGTILANTSSVNLAYSDATPSISATIVDEYVQDLVGAMATDSSTIDFTYNDSLGTLTADVINSSITYAKIQNVSATQRVLGRISSGAGVVEELTAANLVTIIGAGGVTGANPTASVGLTAVNGSATSYMRSDGAPALSQSISPTWTGDHVFSYNTNGTKRLTFTNTNSGASALGIIEAINNASNGIQLIMRSSGGSPANEGVLQVNAGPLRMQAIGGSSTITLATAGTDRATISAAGVTVFNAPSSGIGVTATGAATSTGLFVTNNGAQFSDGSTYAFNVRASANGARIHAGTGTGNNAFIVTDANDVNNLFILVGDGSARFVEGSASAPSITLISDPDTGFFHDTANQIGITLGGTTAGQIAEGSFTGTLTGCTTSPTATFNWQRFGKYVLVWTTAALQATSNALTCTVTGASTAIRPASISYGGASRANDNSVSVACTASMSSGGVITLLRYDGTSFNAAGGTKGPDAGWSMIYPLF